MPRSRRSSSPPRIMSRQSGPAASEWTDATRPNGWSRWSERPVRSREFVRCCSTGRCSAGSTCWTSTPSTAGFGMPVVALTRRPPEFARIRAALAKWFPRDCPPSMEPPHRPPPVPGADRRSADPRSRGGVLAGGRGPAGGADDRPGLLARTAPTRSSGRFGRAPENRNRPPGTEQLRAGPPFVGRACSLAWIKDLAF